MKRAVRDMGLTTEIVRAFEDLIATHAEPTTDHRRLPRPVERFYWLTLSNRLVYGFRVKDISEKCREPVGTYTRDVDFDQFYEDVLEAYNLLHKRVAHG